MQATNTSTQFRNPYEIQSEIHRAGMSAGEMVAWLLIMAALAIGMIWLLWVYSR